MMRDVSQNKGDSVKVVRLLLRINGQEYDAYGVLEDNGDYLAFEVEKIVPRERRMTYKSKSCY
ncbi:MAG TPA: hypothetical protein EYH26_01385 [Pyrodictium sp.]|nr:hypothetical protein [Pyrodictium sp.]